MRLIVFIFMALFIQGCAERPSTIAVPLNTSTQGAFISEQELFHKSYSQLALVAKSIKSEKPVMDEFESFVSIMKTYVSDYANTIETSAYFSQALRILPIPYAGEVSNATRIISNSLVTLNQTASSLDTYQKSSAKFLSDFNQLGARPQLANLERLTVFADDVLIVDALKLQVDMKAMGKTTENLLYVNNLISETSSTASGYFDRVKNFMSSKPKAEEAQAIEESGDTFNAKLQQLNRHIEVLKNSATVNRQNIAKSRVLSDLAVEISRRK